MILIDAFKGLLCKRYHTYVLVHIVHIIVLYLRLVCCIPTIISALSFWDNDFHVYILLASFRFFLAKWRRFIVFLFPDCVGRLVFSFIVSDWLGVGTGDRLSTWSIYLSIEYSTPPPAPPVCPPEAGHPGTRGTVLSAPESATGHCVLF